MASMGLAPASLQVTVSARSSRSISLALNGAAVELFIKNKTYSVIVKIQYYCGSWSVPFLITMNCRDFIVPKQSGYQTYLFAS